MKTYASLQSSFTKYLAARYGSDWLYKIEGTKDDRKIFQKMRRLQDFQDYIAEEKQIHREVEERIKPPHALREWYLEHGWDYERFKDLYDAYYFTKDSIS